MLCRFTDQRALAAWEASPERQWWLRSAQGLAEVTRTERRTGIEGWFDEPVAGEVSTPSSTRIAPPRWKQATTIWLVFFPLSLLTAVTLGELLSVHALRPALTPVVTFVAANVGQLFVGLLVVEGIFRMPGVGGALFASIQNRDRALLVGLVTVVMAAVIIANAIADILAAALDPRVRTAAGIS